MVVGSRARSGLQQDWASPESTALEPRALLGSGRHDRGDENATRVPSRPRVAYSRDGVVSMNARAMVTAMKWLDLIERLIPEEDIKARQCPQPLVHG